MRTPTLDSGETCSVPLKSRRFTKTMFCTTVSLSSLNAVPSTGTLRYYCHLLATAACEAETIFHADSLENV